MEKKVYILADVSSATSEEMAALLNPRRTRRYGPLMKRALTVALKALKESGVEQPDAILNGTALGSLDDTEKMLDAQTAEGEAASTPTHFMQSTHNTVASLVALYIHNHGYNSTYSQGAVSFESALLDAFLQIKLGRIHTALVMVNDQPTDRLRQWMEQWEMGNAADLDRSRAVVLSDEKGLHPLGELVDVVISHLRGQGDQAEVKVAPVNS